MPSRNSQGLTGGNLCGDGRGGGIQETGGNSVLGISVSASLCPNNSSVSLEESSVVHDKVLQKYLKDGFILLIQLFFFFFHPASQPSVVGPDFTSKLKKQMNKREDTLNERNREERKCKLSTRNQAAGGRESTTCQNVDEGWMTMR